MAPREITAVSNQIFVKTPAPEFIQMFVCVFI